MKLVCLCWFFALSLILVILPFGSVLWRGDNIYSHLLTLVKVTSVFWVNWELESPEEELIWMIVLSSHSYTLLNHLVWSQLKCSKILYNDGNHAICLMMVDSSGLSSSLDQHCHSHGHCHGHWCAGLRLLIATWALGTGHQALGGGCRWAVFPWIAL